MTSNSIRIKHIGLAVVASLLMTAGGTRAHAYGRHLALVKSEPANAARLVKAPTAIDLWFTQKPNLKLTRVVLTNATHDTIKLKAPALADTSGKHVSAALVGALARGKYDVNWRTLSRDGHAVAGKFAFSVDSSQGKTTITGSSSTARKPR